MLFLLSLAVLAVAMLAMAIGVLAGRGALRSGCHCAAGEALDSQSRGVACVTCPRARVRGKEA